MVVMLAPELEPTRRVAAAPGRTRRRTGAAAPPGVRSGLRPWISAQSLNVARHAAALRPFDYDEFGPGDAAPSDGHIEAVNRLISSLRSELLRRTAGVSQAAEAALDESNTANLQRVVTLKHNAHVWVQAIERVWDFYFELFGQRQSRFAPWLLSCDRIATDCYQQAYMGLAVAKSIPAPPPFSYMRTGFSPSTFRRGIPLRRLGQQLNPFPLIQLPYHRLVNPWTLGAMLHEVSHNFQNDLGLARAIPLAIARRLLREGHPYAVARAWVRWNRELFADVCGLLLGGPGFVASLLDVLARSPAIVLTFDPRGPHPTPYFRMFINIELLRRIGFPDEAADFRRIWTRIYPDPRAGSLPAALLERFAEANAQVVDTVCFRPFRTLGNKSLSEVIRFAPKEQQLIEETARRLASGTDPGIIPARFLIGAARIALDRRLAQPQALAENFYKELARR